MCIPRFRLIFCYTSCPIYKHHVGNLSQMLWKFWNGSKIYARICFPRYIQSIVWKDQIWHHSYWALIERPPGDTYCTDLSWVKWKLANKSLHAIASVRAYDNNQFLLHHSGQSYTSWEHLAWVGFSLDRYHVESS